MSRPPSERQTDVLIHGTNEDLDRLYADVGDVISVPGGLVVVDKIGDTITTIPPGYALQVQEGPRVTTYHFHEEDTHD